MSEEERSQQRREQDKVPQGGMLNEWVESPNEKQRKTRILLVVIFTRVHTMNRHSVQVWQGKRGSPASVPNVPESKAGAEWHKGDSAREGRTLREEQPVFVLCYPGIVQFQSVQRNRQAS